MQSEEFQRIQRGQEDSVRDWPCARQESQVMKRDVESTSSDALILIHFFSFNSHSY